MLQQHARDKLGRIWQKRRQRRTLTTTTTTTTTVSFLFLLMLTTTTTVLLRFASAFRTPLLSRRTAAAPPLLLLSDASLQARLALCSTTTTTTTTLTTTTRLHSTTTSDHVPKKENEKKKPIPKWERQDLTPDQMKRMESQFEELSAKQGFGKKREGETFKTFHANSDTFEQDFQDDDYWKPTAMDEEPDPPQSMEERIEAARRGLASGRVVVPVQLEEIARDKLKLRKLGYTEEENPYGFQETPRKREFVVTVQDSPLTCNACGSTFQTTNEYQPGYLPPAKYEFQQKLKLLKEKKEWFEKVKNEDREWSPEDEVEYLLQTTTTDDDDDDEKDNNKEGTTTTTMSQDEILASKFDLQDYAKNELGIDPMDIDPNKPIICKRCHGLQNFGTVEEALRPRMDTREPLLSQEQFRQLLFPLRDKKCVILALVDLFDFAGSVLKELDAILGDSDNPVVLAANKADLMPKKMGPNRIENWIRRELEYMGVDCINKSHVRGNVRLVSCRTGAGLEDMLIKVRNLSDKMDSAPVYVVGAANAGKSTLLNWIIKNNNGDGSSSSVVVSTKKARRRRRRGNANQRKGALTVSAVPGTTLQFIEVGLGDGRKLYDTPGLLVPGTFTNLLTPKELKMVVPKNSVEPITFRVGSGKCVLVGGLARIEVVGDDTRPFLFTFYVANSIKLHPTDTSKVQDVLSNHLGKMLTPPLLEEEESDSDGETDSDDDEQQQHENDSTTRLQQWQYEQEWDTHDVTIQGMGWKEAAADIALCGLGWVAVTGAGSAQVKITVPKGIGVAVRPPLMPFDIWATTAKYTGSKATRKSSKSRWSGKRRKGVGRR